MLDNHHLYLVPNCLHSPKGNPVRLAVPPAAPPPALLTTGNCVSTDLFVLHVLCAWNPTTRGLCDWLLSLSTMISRLVHWIPFLRTSVLLTAEPLLLCDRPVCPLLALVTGATVNTCVQVFVTSEVEVAGRYRHCVFYFLKNCFPGSVFKLASPKTDSGSLT